MAAATPESDPGRGSHPDTVARAWLDSYPPGVPPDYLVPPVALPRFLDDAVRDFPTRVALHLRGGPLEHLDVASRVEDFAAALRSTGVGPGDRVLVGLPNGASLSVVLFAVWRCAAVAVVVPATTASDRIAALAVQVTPAVTVGTRRFVRAVPEAASHPVTTIVIDDDTWLVLDSGARFPRIRGWLRRARWVPRRRGHVTVPDGSPGTAHVEDATRPGEILPTPDAAVGSVAVPGPDDPALLTIEPGAAPDAPPLTWTHTALVAAAFQVRLWVPDIQAGVERVLVTGHGGVPAHLAAGPLLATLAAGSLHCLDDPDPSELARVIERDRPTVLVSDVDDLPALVSGGDAARRDLTSLRVVLGIGPPADPGLVERIERRTAGARVRTLFGVPGVVLTHAQPIYGRFVPDAIGLPLTATIACVADPDDLDVIVSPGTPGRLLVDGPQRSAGPWGASRILPVRGPWQVTDALVTVDEDGVFRHLGTLGDMVRREGTWVSRAAIEAVLESHAGVRRAVVVAGERDEPLLAAVVCGRRHRPTADQLRVYCRAHLDSPAVPDDVILLDEIPTTDTGTPAHDALRALLTEGRAR